MELDIVWVLLGLPAVFVLGWVSSRFDLRQLRVENRQAPKAYFRGLNFLLNEQQDQAIDAFIEAVQNDPDTSELHFALGNLFRRRGEYERAVRVHEHLIARADLTQADRERAQHALALDFLKAGLLDRAESALAKLEGTPFEGQARLARLAIYERSRDWPRAAEIAGKLESAGEGSFSTRLAHYLCEQAMAQVALGNDAGASDLLRQAVANAPHAPRPRLELAALCMRNGQVQVAYEELTSLAETVPTALPLIAPRLREAAQIMGREKDALQMLKACYAASPSLDVLDGIVALESTVTGAPDEARQWYARHLAREPSLVAAARWLAGEKIGDAASSADVQRALDHAVKPLSRYRCAACGFEARQHFWHCPGCQAWDSYPARRVEES